MKLLFLLSSSESPIILYEINTKTKLANGKKQKAKKLVFHASKDRGYDV